MKLAQYIDENGYRAPWFAKKIGVTHVTLWNWMKGKRNPSNPAIQLIKIHTNGLVSEKDWDFEPNLPKSEK